MDTTTEIGRNPVSTRYSLSIEMGSLTRDGTTEPLSRDQILRRGHVQGNLIFPVQVTTSRIGNFTRLILTPAVFDDTHSIRVWTMDGGHSSRNILLFAPKVEVKYHKSLIMLRCLDSSRNMIIKIIVRCISKYTHYWKVSEGT